MAADDREGRTTRVIVVGAGIVGACVAWELVKRGAQVTLVDRGKPEQACSFGNSGAISPGSVVPLAMPGIVALAPCMLLDVEGPVHVPLAYLPRAWPWLLQFAASARPRRIEATAAALRALHIDAVDLHLRLAAEIGAPELVVRRGHLHVYPNWAALEKDEPSWRLREELGIRFDRLNRAGIVALEPNIGPRYTLGIYLADHAMVINPQRYVEAIVKAFAAHGGLVAQDRIVELHKEASGGWICRGEQRRFDADHVVVAAGAWSAALLRPLGILLPMESLRGYHVTFKGAYAPVSRTVVLADRKAFATPMEEGLRVGGTVEFGGLRRPPDFERSALLARFAHEAFPGLAGLEKHYWMGHRPCMPDSLPRIGAAPDTPGLWLAVGHGHLGLTGAVKTSRVIADRLLQSP